MEVPEGVWLAAMEDPNSVHMDRLAFSVIRQLHLDQPNDHRWAEH